MTDLRTISEQFDNTVNGWLSFVDSNEYVSAALSLFLIVYAAYAAPKLPGYILRLFDNPLFKLVLFFLIVYTAKRNPTVAIVAAIGLMVTLHALNKLKLDHMMMTLMSHNKPAMQEEMTHEEMRDHMSMEETAMEEMSVPAEAMAHGIQEEVNGEEKLPMPPTPGTQCTKRLNYKNNFYPQYVNMKPTAYQARYTGNEVNGFDPNSGYASI